MVKARTVTTDELMEKYNVSAQEIEAMLERKKLYDAGQLPPAVRVEHRMGRPPLTNEKLVSITFKAPASVVEQLTEKLAERGETRSHYLRRVLEQELAIA